LIGYYFCKGSLRSIDGMAEIGVVTAEIGRVLDSLGRIDRGGLSG
jgi:hypothetical protein